MSNPLSPLNRQILSQFLPNHEAIKAFENLLKTVGVEFPIELAAFNAALEEAAIASQSTDSKANQALDSLSRIAQSLETLAIAPTSNSLDELVALRQRVADLEAAPLPTSVLVLGAVIGPLSAINGNVALFDGVTGKLIKDGGTLGTAAFTAATAYDAAGAAAAVTPATLGLVIGTNTQAHGAKLDSIQALANAAGWLHNDGAGTFVYSTPTAAQVGAPSGSGTSTGANTGDQDLSTLAPKANPTFTGVVTGPEFLSSSATVNMNNVTPTTIFALPDPGTTIAIYLICASIDTPSATPTTYGAYTVACIQNAAAKLMTTVNGSNGTITLSGTNVQYSQSSGGNQDVKVRITRLG